MQRRFAIKAPSAGLLASLSSQSRRSLDAAFIGTTEGGMNTVDPADVIA